MSKNIAIITGANSGLGKEFVKQINIQKLDELWVIGLVGTELEKLKKEITTPTKIIAMDLVKSESIDEIKLLLKIEKPVVKWLINAATITKFGSYNSLTYKEQKEMIDVNCSAMVELITIVVPYMEKYSKIINVSSVAAFQAVPYLSTYAATKAFVLNYTRGIKHELKPKGISVTCVCPFWTMDKINKSLNVKENKISNYVCTYSKKNIAVQAIKDAIKGKILSIYGKKAKIQHIISKLLPTRILIWLWKKQQKIEK